MRDLETIAVWGSFGVQHRPALSIGVAAVAFGLTANIALAVGDAPCHTGACRKVANHPNPPSAQPPPRRSTASQTLVTSQPLPDITPTAAMPVATSARLEFADPHATLNLTPTSERHATSFLQSSALLLAVLAAVGWGAVWRFPDRARQAKAAAATRLLGAIVVAETTASHVAAWLRAWRFPVRFRPSPSAVVDLKAANAVATVSAMLTDAHGRLADLRGAGPLNDVLTHELSQLRSRLTTLEIAASEGEDAAARASPGFRNLVRDIERVRRIADSAALSIGGSRSPTRIPATRAEAYDLLGLNPDVADGTLKKVADGLRMSWHPDHARDATDRAAREARTKQINVAWDLISGRRQAA